MQRIVINTCIGGFGLSHKAIIRYGELKGIKIKAKLDNDYGETPKELFGDSLFTSYYYPSGDFFSQYKILKDDIHLIQVIEELGEKANGEYAYLKIVDIPDDVDWIIMTTEEGYEYVAEKHRTWE